MTLSNSNKITDFGRAAAELGRRGGKVSKRRPGKVRLILEDVCLEVGCTSNRAVFDYLRTFKSECDADSAPDGTCWYLHRLWAERVTCESPPNERTPDSAYVYHYYDETRPSADRDQIIDARTIRQHLWRMRSPDKRLSETPPCDNGHMGSKNPWRETENGSKALARRNG
jgi:hypothetical protein